MLTIFEVNFVEGWPRGVFQKVTTTCQRSFMQLLRNDTAGEIVALMTDAVDDVVAAHATRSMTLLLQTGSGFLLGFNSGSCGGEHHAHAHHAPPRTRTQTHTDTHGGSPQPVSPVARAHSLGANQTPSAPRRGSLARSHLDSPQGDTRRGHARPPLQGPSTTREAAASTGTRPNCKFTASSRQARI